MAQNTLLGLMRSGISFHNVRLWAVGGGCANSHQIQNFTAGALEKYDLNEWADVLTAPIEKLTPGRHEMTFVLKDVEPARVVDFAKTLERNELLEKQTQESVMEHPQFSLPY